jgi:predicted dienelactone hydrolase
MAYLGQIIRDVQRDAAALSTDELRDEIEINLDVQDAVIRQLLAIRPGTGTAEDLIVTTGAVWIAILTTALYVRELTSRPVDRLTVGISLN